MGDLTQAQVDEVTEYAAYLTEGIEHIERKDYIATALASHIHRRTGLPQDKIRTLVRRQFGWGNDHQEAAS